MSIHFQFVEIYFRHSEGELPMKIIPEIVNLNAAETSGVHRTFTQA